MTDLEDAWNEFLKSGEVNLPRNDEIVSSVNENQPPSASELYISTKTKILYLNTTIDLNYVFWKIDIIPYNTKTNGVIKKQMKFISNSKSELDNIQQKLQSCNYYNEYIIQHLEQQQGNNILYKDSRKISIGVCNKDLTNERSKPKSAFYNCFVIILRLLYNGVFKEIHIKIFNTGKVEIPGVQNDEVFYQSISILTNILSNITNTDIYYDKHNVETVLINSNFHCGFCINRPKLFDILKHKHNFNVSYDPCSYPGIQCVYYHDLNTDKKADEIVNNKNICKISYMIFRTGSILIVGKCSEEILKNHVYKYIKELLEYEYKNIYISNNLFDLKNQSKKEVKNKKIKKKVLLFTNQ